MRFTKEEFVAKYGSDLAQMLLETEFEPTGRYMYEGFEDPSHIGKNEWASETDMVNENMVTTYAYLTKDDDPENFDWENNVEFEVL